MDAFVQTYNTLLSVGSILALSAGVALLIIFFTNTLAPIQGFIKRNILVLGFTIALIGIAGSLIYSNVIGYPPCMFCWYGRIFLYPQAFLFGYALWKNDHGILPYTTILTVAGALITGYHYFFIDLARLDLIPCAAQGVSCSIRYVYEWGFVTIPFMAFASFIFLLSLLLVAQKKSV